MQFKGRGHSETAAAWRLQQQLANLKAACLAAPGQELLPLGLARELGQAVATLCTGDGGRCRASRDGSGANSGSGREAPPGPGAELHAAAACIQSAAARHGGSAFAVSLMHAHLFLAWDEVQHALHVTGSSTDGSSIDGCSEGDRGTGSDISSNSSASEHESGEEEHCNLASDSSVGANGSSSDGGHLLAARDATGPAAGWRLSAYQYGGLLTALGWHELLIDMMLWLPGPEPAPLQARLLRALARGAPAAAARAMRILAPATGAGGRWDRPPCAWWAALLMGLSAETLCEEPPPGEDCCTLLAQLAAAAAWGLAAPAHKGGGGPLTPGHAAPVAVAAAALELLEPLLGAWQAGLAATAAPGGSGSSSVDASQVLSEVAQSLEGLQPLLQAQVAVWTKARHEAGPGGGATAAATAAGRDSLSAATLIHANTRIMLCLMAWRPVLASGAANGCATAGSTAVGDGCGEQVEQQQRRGAWEMLLRSPAQPEAVWHSENGGGPWAPLLAPRGGRVSAPKCEDAAVAAATRAPGQAHGGSDGSSHASRSALIASVLAQARPQAQDSQRPAGKPCSMMPAPLAPLLRMPAALAAAAAAGGGAAGKGPTSDPSPAAQHCLALACAWLTPGATSWWQLPRLPSVVAAAGADAFAPGRLLAALLEMLAHVCASGGGDGAQDLGPGGSEEGERGHEGPRLDPAAARALLVALSVAVGSHVAAPEQQAALLAVAAKQAPRAALAARPLAVLQERIARGGVDGGGDTPGPFARSTEAALVAVSNRLISRDADGQEVVPSSGERARVAAEVARALLPHALLSPGLVLRRLLQDGIKHRCVRFAHLGSLRSRQHACGQALQHITGPYTCTLLLFPLSQGNPRDLIKPPPLACKPHSPPLPRAQQPVIVQLLGALRPLCLTAPGGPSAPSHLLRQLRTELLGGAGSRPAGGHAAAGRAAAAPPASGAERAAAAELVSRLLAARLLDGGQARTQLVIAPLQQVWDDWAAGDGGGWDRGGLRMLLELAGLLLNGSGSAAGLAADAAPGAQGAVAAAGPGACLAAKQAWAMALGLSAAAEQLRCGLGGSVGIEAPDYAGLAQAEQLLGVLAAAAECTAAAASPAAGVAAAVGRAPWRAADSGGKEGVSPGEAAVALSALPWARRMVLLPLIEATSAHSVAPGEANTGGGDSSSGGGIWSSVLPPAWREVEALLRPDLRIAAGNDNATSTATAVHVLQQALAFAASNDAQADMFAAEAAVMGASSGDSRRRALQTGVAAPGKRVAAARSSGLARPIAADLAAAVLSLPGDALRRGLLLATAELMAAATDAAGQRVLLVALPAVLATRAAPAPARALAPQQPQPCQVVQGLRPSQAVLAYAAAMELACRAALTFLAHSRWARAAAPAARQQVAEQCFRHISSLAVHSMVAGTGPAEVPQPQQRGRRRQHQQHQQHQQQEVEVEGEGEGEGEGDDEKAGPARMQAAASLQAAQVALRECCRLAALLEGRYDAGPLRPLLLRLLGEVCQPTVVQERAAVAQPEDSTAAQPTGSAAQQAQSAAGHPADGASGLAALRVACTGESLEALLAWAGRQVALLPAGQRALLLPAMVHMAAAAAAAAGAVRRGVGGSGEDAASALYNEVEAVVEVAIEAAASAAPPGQLACWELAPVQL
jgi:hypothetical protein